MAPDDDTADGIGADRSDGDLLDDIAGESSATATLIGSLYRGELDRTTSWRSRLDQTTNWAVVIVGAILTLAFSGGTPHYVILIGVFGVTAFLLIEAHRYQEYDIWRNRVRLLQRNVYATVLCGHDPAEADWRNQLGESLREPDFTMSYLRAVGHRLRRTFLALLLILLAAWVARITVFEGAEGWRQTAAIPGVDGAIVVLVVGVFYVVLGGAVVWSAWGGAAIREFER